MRYQLVLVVFWLQIAICSQEGTVSMSDVNEKKIVHTRYCIYVEQVASSGALDDTSPIKTMCQKKVTLQPGNICMTKINCEDQENTNDDSEYNNCTISYDDEHYTNNKENCKVLMVEYECDECPSSPEATSEVQQQFTSDNNSTIVAVLGALLGLLLVLLAVVTTTLVGTCWQLKKRGGLNFNAEHQIR